MAFVRNIIRLIRENKPYFVCYLIFLIAGGLVLLANPKGTVLLAVNKQHHPVFDFFFKYYTNVGDGLFYIAVILTLLFVSFKNSLQGLISYSLTGIVSQIVKKIADTDRPLIFFQNKVQLYLVPGVHVYLFWSFPSGHSATAFAIFLLLSYIVKDKRYNYIFFAMALLVGISRVYLVQHFFVDVYFGSLIGMVITVLSISLVETLKSINNRPAFSGSLYRLLKNNRKKL